MPPIKIDSSWIESAEYHPAAETLDITLNGGRAYRYFAVPEPLAEAFFAAASKGGFYNEHLKNRFPAQRLAPDP